MVLPGVQALLGFQLIAVFNARFASALDPTDQRLHLVAFVLCATAIALLMTPAAYHRQVLPDQVSPRFVRLAGRLLTSALAPLAIAIGLDGYIVSRLILDDRIMSIVIGSTMTISLVGLWFVYPWIERARTGGEDETRR